MDINKHITINSRYFNCSDDSPLNYAARIGNPEIFKILFDHPEINPAEAPDQYGFTPLITACRQRSDGHHEIVKMILDDPNKAIDPCARSTYRYNTLDFCVTINNLRSGCLLIADGRLTLDDVDATVARDEPDNLAELAAQTIPQTQTWRKTRQSAPLAAAQPQNRKQ